MKKIILATALFVILGSAQAQPQAITRYIFPIVTQHDKGGKTAFIMPSVSGVTKLGTFVFPT